MTAKRTEKKQLVCPKCDKAMRFDDKDELAHDKYRIWYLCDACGVSCVVNEVTGELSWTDADGIDLDIPF